MPVGKKKKQKQEGTDAGQGRQDNTSADSAAAQEEKKLGGWGVVKDSKTREKRPHCARKYQRRPEEQVAVSDSVDIVFVLRTAEKPNTDVSPSP